MKQFENGHILFLFLFLLLWNGEYGWFRVVLRLTDSLFFLLLLLSIFLWEIKIEWVVTESWENYFIFNLYFF